jgi:hypothetical protein
MEAKIGLVILLIMVVIGMGLKVVIGVGNAIKNVSPGLAQFLCGIIKLVIGIAIFLFLLALAKRG